MSLDLWNLRALLFGTLAGLICVGGLHFGTRALMMATRDDLGLSPAQKSRQKALGFIIVLGQFGGAFGVVAFYLTQTENKAVIPLAFGIILSVFVGNLLFDAMRK